MKMNILVTGSNGMVGTALVNNFKNIRDGKNKTRPNIKIDEIYEYDMENTKEELEEYCQKCDFVFNLAGMKVADYGTRQLNVGSNRLSFHSTLSAGEYILKVKGKGVREVLKFIHL